MARRIEVDIVANDRASGVFNQVRASASNFSTTLMNTLGGSLNAVGRFDSSLRTYNSAMYGFNRVAIGVFRAAGDSIYNFTKDAINNFSSLEQQHAKTMGAMATEYEKTAAAQQKFLDDSQKLKQQALQLGTTGPNGRGSLYNINDVSYAQTALVKSGMSADQLLNSNVIPSILKFAGGNDLSIDEATMFAVNLGTVFKKPVEEWGAMLDMVTKAADISVVDVQDIMQSLTYTGGIASGLGRDLPEVLGALSIMGQAGLRGRVAGTGMQAFFTRILSAGELGDKAIGNAPSEYVGQMYNAFIGEAVNEDGSFKSMDEVASLLDTAMESLNDQEQAWFAKKLFGLYQMKAAYALTGAVDGDTNAIADAINQIENQSEGTNDAKYNLMLASQYGKLQSLGYAWEGIKTDFGDRLSPVVSTVADELFNFLSDPENYKIDWSALETAITESGDLIGEGYGQKIAEAVTSIMNTGLDATRIAGAVAPHAGGIISGISKLFQGDISGALEDFKEGLDNTNTEIEKLPPELQGSAEAARNVITAFTTLSAINLGTNILQIITTAFNTFIGKPVSWVLGKITSATTNVSSANSTVNANYVGVNTGTTSVQSGTASVNIGSVPLMNVTASIVNVFGGGGLGGGGTPLLGGSPLLPTLTGGAGLAAGLYAGGKMLAAGSTPLLLGSGGSQLLLGAGATGAGIGATGKIINMYKVGGTYMTGSQALKTIGGAAFRGLGLVGNAALLMSMTGSSVQEDSVFYKNLQAGMDAGLSGDALRQYVISKQYGASDHMAGQSSEAKNATDREYAADMFDAVLERSGYFGSQEGLTEVLNKLIEHYESGGNFNEDYFKNLFSYTASNGIVIPGTQEFATAILNMLFSGGFKPSWIYGGSYNDDKMGNFISGAIEGGNFNDLSSLPSVLSQYETISTQASDTIGEVNDAIARIENPIVNVNVTTNVDKTGNAATDVDVYTTVGREAGRRAGRYGQTAMDK